MTGTAGRDTAGRGGGLPAGCGRAAAAGSCRRTDFPPRVPDYGTAAG